MDNIFVGPKKNIITVLDVGTSKMACLMARIYDDKINVIGCSCKSSAGIKDGMVADIKKANESIVSVIEDVEHMSGESIEDVYVTVSGCRMSSEYSEADALLGSHEISEKDLNAIINKGHERFKTDELIGVLHCLPVEYVLDGNKGISNPCGMYGNALTVRMHLITAHKSALFNLTNCLAKCYVGVSGYIASPCAVGASCVLEDEKQLGVTVVDIGGGGASIGVFRDGKLIYVDRIPFGGLHITKDIACAFSTSITLAEKIKLTYGDAMPTANDCDEYLDWSLIGSDSAEEFELPHITKMDLADVIRPRVEEILEMVSERLTCIGGDGSSMLSRVVLTGGTSKLQGIRQLASHILNANVRIGRSGSLYYSEMDLSDPSLSSLVGSVLFVRSYFDSSEKGIVINSRKTNNGGVLGRWFKKYV